MLGAALKRDAPRSRCPAAWDSFTKEPAIGRPAFRESPASAALRNSLRSGTGLPRDVAPLPLVIPHEYLIVETVRLGLDRQHIVGESE